MTNHHLYFESRSWYYQPKFYIRPLTAREAKVQVGKLLYQMSYSWYQFEILRGKSRWLGMNKSSVPYVINVQWKCNLSLFTDFSWHGINSLALLNRCGVMRVKKKQVKLTFMIHLVLLWHMFTITQHRHVCDRAPWCRKCIETEFADSWCRL